MDILNKFSINHLLLAAQVVNFFILLFILKRFLYKPVLKVLEERKKKIEDSLKNAEEIERKLEETNEKIDRMMVKTADEIQKMHDEAKKDRDVLKEEGKAEAQQLALQIIKKGEEQAKAEREKMQEELMSHMAEFVVAGMEKVIGKVLNEKAQREIVEKGIKNLS